MMFFNPARPAAEEPLRRPANQCLCWHGADIEIDKTTGHYAPQAQHSLRPIITVCTRRHIQVIRPKSRNSSADKIGERYGKIPITA